MRPSETVFCDILGHEWTTLSLWEGTVDIICQECGALYRYSGADGAAQHIKEGSGQCLPTDVLNIVKYFDT